MAQPPIIPGSAAAAAAETAEMRSLSLDLFQMCIDLAGLVDPTPITGGISTLISLGRGEWLEAAISGASMIPFIGELAKVGKLAKDIRTLEKALELAKRSEQAAELLRPVFNKLSQVLDLFPENVSGELGRLRQLVDQFKRENKVASTVSGRLPDISEHFNFREFDANGYHYHEGTGDLGVPGKVAQNRSKSAQSSVSKGTGDDAGHLIGNRFGAPGGAENLEQQNFIQNQYGTFKELENEWERKLKVGTGIRVKVQDVFRNGETRPFMRRAEWEEIYPNGVSTQHELTFANTHTPKSRDMQEIPPTVPPGTRAQVFDLFSGQRLQ